MSSSARSKYLKSRLEIIPVIGAIGIPPRTDTISALPDWTCSINILALEAKQLNIERIFNISKYLEL